MIQKYRLSRKLNAPKPSQGQQKDCYCCEGKHKANDGDFKEAICLHCKKSGHLVRICQEFGLRAPDRIFPFRCIGWDDTKSNLSV